MELSWEYIAGFFDGEGCCKIFKYQNPGCNAGQRPYIGVNQKTENDLVLQEIAETLDEYDITYCLYSHKYKEQCKMTVLKMQDRKECLKFISYILPYIIVKKRDVLKVKRFCERALNGNQNLCES